MYFLDRMEGLGNFCFVVETKVNGFIQSSRSKGNGCFHDLGIVGAWIYIAIGNSLMLVSKDKDSLFW